MDSPISSLLVASPLDKVIYFFETVFSGRADESPEERAQIDALIKRSFDAGYIYNGKPQSPEELIAFRNSLLTRFKLMAFRVNSAISAAVDAGTPTPTTAVVIAWTINGVEPSGNQYQLNGMNMIGQRDGKAATNNQLGDPDKGWRQVPTTP